MGKKLKLLGALVLCTALALTGCGGGGSPSGTPGQAAGVAVDPYIVGGIFQEIDANGTVIQETLTPSDSMGKFAFPRPLTIGNTISLKSGTGTDGGVPFTGSLKRVVDASSNSMVLNPLTTLLANGVSPADVLALLNAITPGVTFTLADLTADPMARLSDGEMTAADKALLAANMAVNAAVEILDGNIGSLANLTSVAEVIAEKLITEVLDTLTPTSTPAALTAAATTGVTVTNYIEETVVVANDGTTDVGTVTEDITPAYIDQVAVLVTANPIQPVIITDVTIAPVQVADMNKLAQIYYAAGQVAYTEGSATDSTATLMTAIEKFNAAAALAGSVTEVALKDKILFFGAFAKVLQVAKPMTDGADNGLNNFGDVLDAFGLAGGTSYENDRSNLNAFNLDTCTTDGSGVTECTVILSTDSPNSAELQGMLYNTVGISLKDAVAMLGQVSGNFAETVSDAGVLVEFDATDAKFISAVANGMLAQINIVQAYDINIDIYAETNRETSQTPEQFLAANPTLGKLKDAARMADVKTYATAAITALEAAVAALDAEADSQSDDFVKLDNTICTYDDLIGYNCTTTYNNPVEMADFVASLAEAKTAINASTYNVIDDGEDGIAGNSDDTVAAVINVSKFFAGVDLRSTIPTTYNKGAFADSPGMLNDPTFGGVLTQVNGQAPSILNTDDDGDGSPDIFGMTYFEPGMFANRTYYSYAYGESFSQNWEATFNADNSFFGTITTYFPTYAQTPITGNYGTVQNILTLNITSGDVGVTKLVSKLTSAYSKNETYFNVETEVFNDTVSLGAGDGEMYEPFQPMPM